MNISVGLITKKWNNQYRTTWKMSKNKKEHQKNTVYRQIIKNKSAWFNPMTSVQKLQLLNADEGLMNLKTEKKTSFCHN